MSETPSSRRVSVLEVMSVNSIKVWRVKGARELMVTVAEGVGWEIPWTAFLPTKSSSVP